MADKPHCQERRTKSREEPRCISLDPVDLPSFVLVHGVGLTAASFSMPVLMTN